LLCSSAAALKAICPTRRAGVIRRSMAASKSAAFVLSAGALAAFLWGCGTTCESLVADGLAGIALTCDTGTDEFKATCNCDKTNEILGVYDAINDANSGSCTEDNWWTTNRAIQTGDRTSHCCQSVELKADREKVEKAADASCSFPAQPTECCGGLEIARTNFESDKGRCDSQSSLDIITAAFKTAICTDRTDCNENPICLAAKVTVV